MSRGEITGLSQPFWDHRLDGVNATSQAKALQIGIEQ